MDIAEFRESLQQKEPPKGMSQALLAMWWDGKEHWNQAHETAQDAHDRDGAWVHAYLHRKEGDLSNAKYWYSQAERPVGYGDLRNEWLMIVGELLRGRG